MSFSPPDLLAAGFPAQQAYLAIELPPASAAEKRRLTQVRQHVLAHTHTPDLRELAGAVKTLLGCAYEVGCGSAHIWIKRTGEPERLAIIADRLTTAYRDWFEPQPPTGATTATTRTGGCLLPARSTTRKSNSSTSRRRPRPERRPLVLSGRGQ